MASREQEVMTQVLRALSVEKRVEIVRHLAGQTLCVGALSKLLGISAGAVSQHLRVLKDAGLVEADRQGYFVHYKLVPNAGERCCSIVESLFRVKKGRTRCVKKKRIARSRGN